MKQKIVLFLLFLSTSTVVGQNQVRPNDNLLRKNTDFYSKEKADAVVLSETGLISFGFDSDSGFILTQTVKRIIQINTEEGKDKAILSIPFYAGKYGKENVEIIEYKISRKINNEVVIIKVQKAENRQVGTDYYVKEIDVKDIQVGDIVEYSYDIEKNNIDEIPTWYFQDNIPKLKSNYIVKIPENLTYLIATTGSINIKKEEELSQRARSFSLGGFGETFRLKELTLTFSAVNIPPMVNEPFGGNLKNSLASIGLNLIQFQYPNSTSVSLPYKENDVAKEIYKNKNFSGELNQVKFMKKNFIEDSWNTLEPKQRIDTVFTALKKRISWNGEYSLYAYEGVRKSFYTKTGNSADINLMLIAGLNAADIKAEPVVLSTRMNGKAPSFFPRFLNHVIARVELEGKQILLDATDPNALVDLLPIEDLNTNAWLLNDNYTAKMIETTPSFLSINQDNFTIELSTDGHAKGSVVNSKTMYEAYLFKSKFKANLILGNRADIERRSPKFFLKNGIVNSHKESVLDFRFELQQFSFAEVKQNRITFKPFAYYKEQENPFTAPTRDLDIDFLYPSMEDYSLEIKIPDGYHLGEMPQPINLIDRETGLKFSFLVEKVDDSTYRFKMNLRISKVNISKEHYSIVKAFYEQLYSLINQEIEFKKG